MPRRPSPTLTDGELRLMNALWDRGPLTVLDLQAALDEDLADSTIRTLLRILEDKGYVGRERQGRAHLYRAAVGRDETRSGVVRYVVDRFFRNPADLMLNILDSEDLDEEEIERLEKALNARKGRS